MTKKRAKPKSRTRKSRKSRRTKRPISGLRAAIAVVVVLGFLLIWGLVSLYGPEAVGPLGEIFIEPTQTPRPIVNHSESTASESGWWHVYFTSPDPENPAEDFSGSVAETLIDYINIAQESIHIAAFEFDIAVVTDALLAAQARGVEVLWVTDDEFGLEADQTNPDGGHFARLQAVGIQIKDDNRTALMHNKFWIFDRDIVWTGSTNITRNGILRNNNNVITISSPELASIYEREFTEMWNGEFGPTSTSTAGQQVVVAYGTPIQVLFAAEDEVAEQLTALIQEAQSNIRFMAFSFTRDDMGQAMLARTQAGVDLKGIFETRGSETEFSELTYLYCNQIDVRQDGNPRIFHHKVLIIDDTWVVTGSFNFSDNANDNNDENVIIIEHRDIAAAYLQEFERRWAETTALSEADISCN